VSRSPFAPSFSAAYLAVACQSTQQLQPCAGQLCGAFQAYEETESGERIHVEPDRHLAPLDYQSRLRIVPDATQLSRINTNGPWALAPRSAEVTVRLASTAALLELARRYVDSAKEAERVTLMARDKPAPDSISAARAAIRAQAQLGLDVVKNLEQIANARARAAQLEGKQQQAYVETLIGPLLEDAEGNDVTLNLERFAALLEDETRFSSERVLQDQETVVQQGTLSLRIRAFLIERDARPVAVHVVNYDDIEDPRPTKEKRVAFRMSPADQQRVQSGWQMAEQAAALIHQWKSDANGAREDLTRLGLAIKQDLAQLEPPPGAVIPSEVKSAFGRALAKVTARAPAEGAAMVQLRTTFEAHEATLEHLRASVVELRKNYAARDMPALLQALGNLRVDLRNFVEQASALPGELTQALNAIQRIIPMLAASDADAELLEAAFPRTKTAAEEFHSKHVQRIVEFAATLQKASARARVVELADNIDSDVIDPRVRALPLDKAPVASVTLSDTPADRGSKVVVKAEVVTGPPEQQQVVDVAESTYEVERFGLNSDFNAGLIFVKRFGDGAPTDRDVNYDPAPSFSWILRYSVRDSAFWNTLGLGLGFGTTALQFSDGAPQVGLGPELSVFHGILYGGLGWNLQVREDREYWYLGVGILEAVQRATASP
jgi:hypothetical protein